MLQRGKSFSQLCINDKGAYRAGLHHYSIIAAGHDVHLAGKDLPDPAVAV